jgi:Histidine kinase-like ATPase domain
MPPPAPEAVGVAPTAGEQNFRLRLAPEASLIVTARLFASGLARLSGCGEERVEDVKLAVSEACAFALTAGEATDSLIVDVHKDANRLTFEVGPAPDAPPRGRDVAAAALPQGLDLIRLIFDDARVTTGTGAAESVVSFSVALDEAPFG